MTTERLAKTVTELSERVDVRFEQIDARFEQIDRRFEQVDKRFEQVDKRFEQVDKRFEQIDKRFEQVDKRFEQIDERLERLERRFDEFRVEMRTERRAELEEFADRIEHRVQILLEGMTDQFRFAFDRNTATAQHLDAFERANADEHRVMQTRIDDLDVKFRSRRPGRRPS